MTQDQPVLQDGDALQPCPICRAEARPPSYHRQRLGWYIQCSRMDCLCKTGPHRTHLVAISKWNTRSTHAAGVTGTKPAPDAVREALRRELRINSPHDYREWISIIAALKRVFAAPAPSGDGTMSAMNEALARQYNIPDELWRGATKDDPKVPPSSDAGAAEPDKAREFQTSRGTVNLSTAIDAGLAAILDAAPPVRGDREAIARVIDPEAYKAVEDGRDKHPNSLWHLRRTWAEDKADVILSLPSALIPGRNIKDQKP